MKPRKKKQEQNRGKYILVEGYGQENKNVTVESSGRKDITNTKLAYTNANRIISTQWELN